LTRERAIAFLSDSLAQLRDPDPDQRDWKLAFAEGAVGAFERVGVLSGNEADRWRERFAMSDEAVDPLPALARRSELPGRSI